MTWWILSVSSALWWDFSCILISALWSQCDITKLKPFLWFDVGWLRRFSKSIIYIHKFCILTALMWFAVKKIESSVIFRGFIGRARTPGVIGPHAISSFQCSNCPSLICRIVDRLLLNNITSTAWIYLTIVLYKLK